MEIVTANSACRCGQCGRFVGVCTSLPNVAGRGARIVDENDQNVGRVGRKPARCHPLLIDRLLHGSPGNAGRERRLEWKDSCLSGLSFGSAIYPPPGLCVRCRLRSNGAG